MIRIPDQVAHRLRHHVCAPFAGPVGGHQAQALALARRHAAEGLYRRRTDALCRVEDHTAHVDQDRPGEESRATLQAGTGNN